METIVLKPVKVTPLLLADLEKRKLLRLLKPSRKIIETRTETGAVDTFYASSPAHGTHKLIGVGKRSTEINLSYHPDNEDFLLVNATGLRFKPLYLVIAYDKYAVFLRKMKSGRLSAADIVVLDMPYNDPRASFFTMLKGTVHCEVTSKGSGQHPVFFVAEPSRLKMNYVVSERYCFTLKGN